MSASRSIRSWLAIRIALDITRRIPFSWQSGAKQLRPEASPSDEAPILQSFDGQRVTNTSGARAYLPQFPKHFLNDLGDVLLRFPHGFSLEFVGESVPWLDISRLGENLLGGDDKACGKIGRFSTLVNKLPHDGLNEVERVMRDCEASGEVHEIPFVIVVLPRSEAYARFPEIAPPSAKGAA